jgi:hypothetical protein
MKYLARFVRLELLALRPYVKTMLLMVVLVAVAVAPTSREPWAVLPALMVMTAMFPSYPFSLDERAHLDVLYATLPLPRSVVVFGRYLTMLILFGGVFLFGTVVTVGVGIVREAAVSPENLLLAAAIGFALFAIVVGGQLPVFFALGFTRARAAAYLPIVVVGFALAGLAQLQERTTLARLITQPALLAVGCLAVGCLALGASIAVSRKLYVARTL